MPSSTAVVLAIALGLSVVQVVRIALGRRWPFGSYAGFMWAFFIAFAVTELWFFRAGNWVCCPRNGSFYRVIQRAL
jgi:hypothetical protein